jgi:gp32 DNA binding protein like
MSLLDAIKNKRSALAAKSGRERAVKLSSNKNLIRLLPNWTGAADGEFSQDFGQHFIKDKAGKIQAVYICTATTFGKQCEVCNEIARHAAETTDEDMVKVLSEARSSSRVLVNAIYMNGAHANAKTDPVLLELPPSVFGMILGIAETYLEDHGINIFDLAEGYDLVVNKTGSGRDTEYTVVAAPKPRAIPANTLEKARDLNAYAQQEYQAGLQKAIASLGAVMGGSGAPQLTGPSGGTPAQKPTAAQNLAAQAPVDFDDVLEGELGGDAPFPPADPAPVVQKPVVQKQAAAAAPAANVSDDLSELDALLELEAA